MVRFGLVLLACCLVGLASAEKARFDNYVVYRVLPNTQEQLTALKQLQEYPDGVSFWSEAHKVGNHVDIMVPPHKQPEFKAAMNSLKISTEVFISNLQENIDNENPTTKAGKAMDWTSYHRIAEIYAWLDDVIAQNPEVTGFIGGSTFEGRQIRGVKVSFGANKPGVFLEGGIHAREWISPATVTYILNELLTSTDPAIRAIAEAYDWYIVPSFNVDGYEYTHTTDRLWRKTRSTTGGLCYGADPNRNWDFHWLEGGSSSSPCSDIYAGSAAFSEIETKTLSEYFNTIADKIDVYLDFHSYSQFIMFPYGLTPPVISNVGEHVSVGTKAASVLAQRYGTKYQVDNLVALVGTSTGGSIDWIKGVHGTTLVFAFELRDTGRYGFVLPANQIIPTGEETLDAVVSILSDALQLVRK